MSKIILSGLFGGCWGFSMIHFALQGNWGMVTLTLGLLLAVFYVVDWMIDLKYRQ